MLSKIACLFFIFISSLTFSSDVKENLIEELRRSEELLNKINKGCRDCDNSFVDSDHPKSRLSKGSGKEADPVYGKSVVHGTKKLKTETGKEFEVSIVDLDVATNLFNKMASQEHIPFGYPEDGCYARAHEMSRLMEKEGVITGKVFIEGNLRVETSNSPKGYVEWWYHVAPIVVVKKGQEEIVYVIDPSIFNKPVPAEEWFAMQTQHPGGKKGKTYETPRFNYTPSNATSEMAEYSEGDIKDMNATLKNYVEIQNRRQAEKK
jgi:hypothetical protein